MRIQAMYFQEVMMQMKLAVRYSLLRPEKIEKTICIGQVANFVPAEEEGYKHARSEALKAGDDVTALDAAFEAFE